MIRKLVMAVASLRAIRVPNTLGMIAEPNTIAKARTSNTSIRDRPLSKFVSRFFPKERSSTAMFQI